MNIYVIHEKDNSWSVKREGEDVKISSHEEKSEAVEAAKEVAIGHDAGIVILRKDGTIENLGAYSIDPFPSEDHAPDFNDEGDEGI